VLTSKREPNRRRARKNPRPAAPPVPPPPSSCSLLLVVLLTPAPSLLLLLILPTPSTPAAAVTLHSSSAKECPSTMSWRAPRQTLGLVCRLLSALLPRSRRSRPCREVREWARPRPWSVVCCLFHVSAVRHPSVVIWAVLGAL